MVTVNELRKQMLSERFKRAEECFYEIRDVYIDRFSQDGEDISCKRERPGTKG